MEFLFTEVGGKMSSRGHSRSTFAQDAEFWPTLPPPPKVRYFWLELTLSSSISILVKFREKKLIASTSIFELNVSFAKPQ